MADLNEHIDNAIGRHGHVKRNLIAAAIVLGIISLFFGAYYGYGSIISKRCPADQDQCFIDAANACENVKMQQTFAGSLYALSAKNCIFTKKVLTVSSLEPDQTKSLLEGSSMDCAYGQDGFDVQLVSSISLGIENCTGELKDSLEEIIAGIAP